jgi:spiro-SPASM protein
MTVLYGGALTPEAFRPVFGGRDAFSLALERAAAFPGSEKTLLLLSGGSPGEGFFLGERDLLPAPPAGVLSRARWTVGELLRVLSEESAGYDFAYYAWADAPFMDPDLAGKIAARHTRFAAEYSYADGWPYGLGPELITGEAAGVLHKIAAGDAKDAAGEGPVGRDSLFAALQKDINSFDIETEISPVDLRFQRLSLTADTRRNVLLLERFFQAGVLDPAGNAAAAVERIVAGRLADTRTLPAYFPIQVSGPCPGGAGGPGGGACPYCPYPLFGGKVTERKDFMDPGDFKKLLAKVEDFAGDAVIGLSLWGELALHPRRTELIEAALERPAFSLVIETSGLGWAAAGPAALQAELDRYAPWAASPVRPGGFPALSWIVSLGPGDLPPGAPAVDSPGGGVPLAGTAGPSEAVRFAAALLSRFPRPPGMEDLVYVETPRTAGEEDAIERFYRAWKAYGQGGVERAGSRGGGAPGIIIQKYDDFCGLLPHKRTVDLSPVERRPCWHIARDFPVLIDGTVPVCREDVGGRMSGSPAAPRGLGNALKEDLETIWKRGEERYDSQGKKQYRDLCAVCDEYYTYNF